MVFQIILQLNMVKRDQHLILLESIEQHDLLQCLSSQIQMLSICVHVILYPPILGKTSGVLTEARNSFFIPHLRFFLIYFQSLTWHQIVSLHYENKLEMSPFSKLTVSKSSNPLQGEMPFSIPFTSEFLRQYCICISKTSFHKSLCKYLPCHPKRTVSLKGQ